ncbi:MULTISPECIES: DUF1329 domain-containing protein [unclassified Pseudomonas]|uniref:DUF1329 domain-containing protein n=1 Tax=unclassified Pseudomonas TaxID=196821 RepID=UPI002448C88C|nr:MULTISPECIES: DUF1329 domain-containing protein [unclassified Pseudomonas]MDH0893591.1 DUF1329 domain-containing protein [Pseudomonas sp. GD03875]MDH1065758.1 DUF1329 domain-containing protein [Pseudomonas sp. GD03985]
MTYSPIPTQLLRAGALGLGLLAGQALAAVPAEQIARLDQDLTPVGAERAGNADGSIPEWTGGLARDAGQRDANGFLADPFAADQPLFTITAANVEQYRDKLTPGQLALFKRYPQTYRIPVYPTRRSVGLPQSYLDTTRQNAADTQLAEGGNGLHNYRSGGLPFAIPQNGLEVIWNHIGRYRGLAFQRMVVQASPQANGAFTPSLIKQQLAYPVGLSDYAPQEMTNILYFYREEFLSPARLAGGVLLVHETINQVKEPRMAWQYNAGQRRVRRAPQIAYDSPGAEGMRTLDDFDMFNGAPDRFDWQLVGKKEMYIPYNSYKLASPDLKYADLIKPGHLDPAHTRYELHRVWHLSATLKPGQRHVYSRRDLFIDEDSWQAAEADAYDGRGQLWRVSEGHASFFYDQQIPLFNAETHYDVLSGRYAVNALYNEEKNAYQFDVRYSRKQFTPGALRASGIR